MPDTESYTLVWLGAEETIAREDVDAITAKSDPRVRHAIENGFGWFCDSFFWDEEREEPIYLLLVGHCLRILGYKEGDTDFRIDPLEVADQARSLRTSLDHAGIEGAVKLFVLFHIGTEQLGDIACR